MNNEWSTIRSLPDATGILGASVRVGTSSMAAILVPALVLIVVFLYLMLKRYATKRRLEVAGIPTVLYRPRFWQYNISDTRKLSSSNITNVWPRMRRMKGPMDVYGTVYGINSMVVHVAHPQLAHAVLNTATSTDVNRKTKRRRLSIWEGSGACKAPAYDHFQDFCGRGVFTADGADWKAKRTAVLHALLRSPKGGYETKITEHARMAANELVDFIAANHQCCGDDTDDNIKEVVNITPILQRCTIGLIYRYITDQSLPEKLGSGEKECSSNLLQKYLESITRIRMIILAQSRSFWFLIPRMVYRACSSLFEQEQDCMISINSMAQLACREAKPESPLGILKESTLYGARTATTGPSQNLLDEAITLLFAGQDTSAATLSWALHLLSIHTDVQSKLAAEVATTVEDGRTKQCCDTPYLDAVIREAMRLYPVAPFVVRRLTAPVTATDKERGGESVTLPQDSLACIWIYSLHRCDRYWNRPDDFWPERWLQTENRDEGISNGAFMPFCTGPRNCVGQPLANFILRTLLSTLVQHFEFVDDRLEGTENVDDLRRDMQAGFTVLPLGGVPLLVRKRKQ